MPGINLTRAEAFARSAHLRVDEYVVTLDLTTSTQTFRSTTTVKFTSSQPGSSTFIDLIAPEVHRVELNGHALDVAEVVSEGRIELPNLAQTNTLVVEADCAYMNTGQGLHRFVDPADNEVYLYTQFQTADCRRMFTVFDQPDLKAAFTFTITAPKHWQVVSCSPTPEPTPADAGSLTWAFEPTPRISCYITALVAGPYHVQRGELTSSDGRTIPLGVFCRASLAEHLDADEIMELTRQGFGFFEKAFDRPYPFTKYDQLFVPEFNAGAMENVGAVTYRDQMVFRSTVTEVMVTNRAVTILHELAHMWFGNLVTMRWWDDIWLNESFATYQSTVCTAEATKFSSAWTMFTSMEKSWAYKQDQLPTTHPIVADMVDLDAAIANFDGITYAKGASVLRQLVAWVGRDHFDRAMCSYFSRHAWGNTEWGDLLHELEAASGRDLSEWGAQWLETTGVNTLSPELSVDAAGAITSLVVRQTAPVEHPQLRPHRVGIGCYNLQDGALVRTFGTEVDVVGERTEISEFVGIKQPDLLLLNDGDLAYTKVRLDQRSMATAVAHLSALTDPLARALVWSAAWDMCRDAEMPGREYVDLVVGNVGQESDPTVVHMVLGQMVATLRRFVAPENRAAATESAADRLWELTQSAAAGSDLQLNLLTWFAELAHTPAHLAAVRSVLDGSHQLAGRTIDTDLRWKLLISLCAGGAAGEDEVSAELVRDNTSSGRLNAHAARASWPLAEAKRTAWNSVFPVSTLSNSEQEHTAGGFAKAHDLGLLNGYPQEFYAGLLEAWDARNSELASQMTGLLFPHWDISAQALERLDSYLTDLGDKRPALRRELLECRSGVERALNAQQRDSKG